MAHGTAFNDVEGKARAAPYSDGVLDLFIAALFLGIAAVWSASRGELVGLLALPIINGGTIELRAVKRRITEPRVGFVEPHTPDPSSKVFGVLHVADSSGGSRYRVMAVLSVVLGFVLSVPISGATYEAVAAFYAVLALAIGSIGLATLVLFFLRHARQERSGT